MRLSEWRKAAPNRECMNPRAFTVLEEVLADLGAESDPYCWVAWGDDPGIRYSVFAPTRAGLANIGMRVNIPEEGPRANGKLVRWSRLQLSDLAIESAGGHRLVALQVEGQVLRGIDAEADRICEFVLGLLAAVDGREWQAPDAGAYVKVAAPAKPAAAAPAPKKPAARKVAAEKAAPPARDASRAGRPAAKTPAATPVRQAARGASPSLAPVAAAGSGRGPASGDGAGLGPRPNLDDRAAEERARERRALEERARLETRTPDDEPIRIRRRP